MTVHIQTSSEVFRIDYPQIEEFRIRQQDIHWTAEEIKVEKDVHDILTNFTEAERHGVFTTLKLFTLYEMKAGSEYWTGRFMKMFPRHEFQSLGATFGMMELAVHKPFYNKINDLLNATDDSFYTDYINNPVLRERMAFIDSIIDHDSDLVSIAGFSMVEGVILYSSFAFLKHFQSLGKNKLVNVVAGINSSAIDEDLHAQAGAWCFKELAIQKNLSMDKWRDLEACIVELADQAYAHEAQIIDMIFEKGDIEGITASDMKIFVLNRIDMVLSYLGFDKVHNIQNSPIDDWFYKRMKSYIMNDFFNRQGREYTRAWSEKEFVW
jgi:ribonucleotide reductase beta subunit family protein with ferritin-like domain